MGVAVFISSCLNHKKFEDRYDSLVKSGFDIHVVGYDWSHGRYSGSFVENNFTKLNRPSRSWLIRFFAWLPILKSLLSLRRKIGKVDLLICNSFECAFWGQLVFNDADRKIFDLADIHNLQFPGSKIGPLIHYFERIFINKPWEYVVTSPWFYWDYLLPYSGFLGNCYLIENKISSRNAVTSHKKSYEGGAIRILWNGILRCNRSARLLLDIVDVSQGAITLRLAGDYKQIDPELMERMLSNSHVENFGFYNDHDIAGLFEGVHYSWVEDLDGDFNSRILLPNRLYQSIFFGCPSLAIVGSSVSKYVSKFNLGVVLPESDFRLLANQIIGISIDQYFKFLADIHVIHHLAVREDEWVRLFKGDLPMALPKAEDLSVLLSY